MSDPRRLFAPGACAPEAGELEGLLARYEWFVPLRLLRARAVGRPDSLWSVVAPWRAESSLRASALDAQALLAVSTDDVIDRFLREEDLRIVAGEGEPVDEVRTEALLEDEDELVSEELAAIYLAQGLRQRAAAIYRKLSLQNPQKSVYFAELLRETENK